MHKLNLKKTTAILLGVFVVVFLFLSFIPTVSATCEPACGDGYVCQNDACVNNDLFGIKPVDENIGLASPDIRLIAAKIIRAVLGLLGLIAVSIVLYAGYTIMTAGGNEEKITKGKKILINAVIGLIIILSAFAIVQFVINALARATGLRGQPSGIHGPTIPNFAGSGGLGRVIEDHYPFRDQTDVARNTKIAITFVEAVEPSTLIANTNQTCWPDDGTNNPVAIDGDGANCLQDSDGKPVPYYGDCILDKDSFSWKDDCDHLVTSSLSIYQSTSTAYNKLDEDFKKNNFVEAAAMAVYFEDENTSGEYNAKTFVFKPFASKTSNLPVADPAYLGSGEVDVPYTVWVTDNIKKKLLPDEKIEDAIGIFDSQFAPFYYWEFKTGTELDFTPPHVTAVRPKADSEVYRNNITQVYFNEAMDPTVTQGYLSSGTTNNVNLFFNTMVTGTWKLTNGYTVSEFLPAEPCGINSCGDTMYCMPVPGCDEFDTDCTSNYGALVRAGLPFSTSSFEAIPFSGVMDMAGNALDYGPYGEPDGQVTPRPLIPVEADYNDYLDNLDENTDPLAWPSFYFEKQTVYDNYWWNYVMQNDIDRTIPYVEVVKPAIDAEGVEGTADLVMNFNRVMWLGSFNTTNLLLAEYPDYTVTKLDDVMSRVLRFILIEDETGDKTELNIKPTHKFGPGGLDLYYFVSASSSIQTETQNCLYPGRGPSNDTCLYEEDENGNVSNTEGCIPVIVSSTKDTGCAQTADANKILQSDIPSCLNFLEEVSIYSDDIVGAGAILQE